MPIDNDDAAVGEMNAANKLPKIPKAPDRLKREREQGKASWRSHLANRAKSNIYKDLVGTTPSEGIADVPEGKVSEPVSQPRSASSGTSDSSGPSSSGIGSAAQASSFQYTSPQAITGTDVVGALNKMNRSTVYALNSVGAAIASNGRLQQETNSNLMRVWGTLGVINQKLGRANNLLTSMSDNLDAAKYNRPSNAAPTQVVIPQQSAPQGQGDGNGSSVGGWWWNAAKTGAKYAGQGAAAAYGATRLRGGLGMLARGGAIYAADAVAGAVGVGSEPVDTAQDDKNWKRATVWEKMQSLPARGIEHVGDWIAPNVANQARTARIASETEYLDKKNESKADTQAKLEEKTAKIIDKPSKDKKNAISIETRELTVKSDSLRFEAGSITFSGGSPAGSGAQGTAAAGGAGQQPGKTQPQAGEALQPGQMPSQGLAPSQESPPWIPVPQGPGGRAGIAQPQAPGGVGAVRRPGLTGPSADPSHRGEDNTRKDPGDTGFVDPRSNPDVNPKVLKKYEGRQLPVVIRNNNPAALSLQYPGSGREFAEKMPGYIGATPRPANEGGYYAKYATPEHGIYANSQLLKNYGRSGVNTPDAIVRKWSTDRSAWPAYSQKLQQALGVGGGDQVDLNDPEVRRKILMAKSAHESGAGQPIYNEDTFKRGVAGEFKGAKKEGEAQGKATWTEGQTERPDHMTGEIDIEGKKYKFGSGGNGYSSIPYGHYPITPDTIGPWGRAHNAIGINNNKIWDPKLKRDRNGIEFHASSSDSFITEGCIGVAGKQYPQLKAHVHDMIRRFGKAYVHVTPQGVSVSPDPHVKTSEDQFVKVSDKDKEQGSSKPGDPEIWSDIGKGHIEPPTTEQQAKDARNNLPSMLDKVKLDPIDKKPYDPGIWSDMGKGSMLDAKPWIVPPEEKQTEERALPGFPSRDDSTSSVAKSEEREMPGFTSRDDTANELAQASEQNAVEEAKPSVPHVTVQAPPSTQPAKSNDDQETKIDEPRRQNVDDRYKFEEYYA